MWMNAVSSNWAIRSSSCRLTLPSTVNLYDAYHVVEGGVVTEIWPVIPRGPGHVGILAGGSS